MATVGYGLTPETAEQLRQLLGSTGGMQPGRYPITHTKTDLVPVRVTGAVVSGRYPGKVQIYREGTGWEDYTTDAKVFGLNGETLTTDTRYLCLRTGNDTSGNPVYIAVGLSGGGGSCSNWVEVPTGVTCSGGTLTVTTKWLLVCGESDTDPT